MSLRFRDELRIVLRPEQVVLARIRRELTRRGLKRHMEDRLVIPSDSATGDDMPWSGALRAIEASLSGFAVRKSHATVILSNHFMRYALVPWNDALSDVKEEMAYAQHSFGETYGRDSKAWELRLCAGRAGVPQMASAVDARLLADLGQLFGRSRIGMKSIQPHLMMAYNACHALLHDRSAWLAIVEQGNLCLALLQEGQWSWVRTMRIGRDWQEELPRFLEREAFMVNIENSPSEVYLWAPEHEAVLPVSDGRWQITQLQPLRVPAIGPEFDGRFSMYMSE